MGLRASATNDVIFEDCFVPDEDLLGVCPDPEPLCFQPTAGFSIGLAAWPLGVSHAAFAYARHVLRRESEKAATGRPVSQEKRRLLARMHLATFRLRAGRSLLHAAWVADTAPGAATCSRCRPLATPARRTPSPPRSGRSSSPAGAATSSAIPWSASSATHWPARFRPPATSNAWIASRRSCCGRGPSSPRRH